ncbi:MAG: hypothetical protein MPN21_01480 [Thermoanaerobaculia bacterium]|nr:hypothetical protein [Thermoanaerobaculia bacterium]
MSNECAIDRIAGLHLPNQAPEVLAQEQYRTEECLMTFLGVASDFAARDPDQGRQVVQIGVQLAQLVPPSDRQRQLLIRSMTLLASTLQAGDATAQAEGIYRTALELAVRAPVDFRVSGGLLRRFASLLRERGQLEEALQTANRAVELLQAPDPLPTPASDPVPSRQTDWPLQLGLALIERARVLLDRQRTDDAIADLGLALVALTPDHDREIGISLDLLSQIAEGTSALDRLHCVARRVTSLRDRVDTRRLRPSTPDARLAARILRLDGRLFHRMGALRRAERSLRQARRLLHGPSDADELLAVALDLADLLAREGRQAELRRLSTEVFEELSEGGALRLTRYRWRRIMNSGHISIEDVERIRQAFRDERATGEIRQQLVAVSP